MQKKEQPPLQKSLQYCIRQQEAAGTLTSLPQGVPGTKLRDALLVRHHSSMLPFLQGNCKMKQSYRLNLFSSEILFHGMSA